MSTPIENFRKGDYFVIYLCNGEYHNKRGDPCVSGEPLKFLAMGLPFIAMQRLDGTLAALDTRSFSIRKVSRDYVRALTKKKMSRRKSPKVIDPKTGKEWLITPIKLNHPRKVTCGIDPAQGESCTAVVCQLCMNEMYVAAINDPFTQYKCKTCENVLEIKRS